MAEKLQDSKTWPAPVRRAFRILEKNPSSLAFLFLADFFRKNGDCKRAVQIASQGLKKHPRNTLACLILGQALISLRLYREAEPFFEQALRQDPENLMALRFLGVIYQRFGRRKKSLQIYSRLRLMAPEWADEIMKKPQEDVGGFTQENLDSARSILSQSPPPDL